MWRSDTDEIAKQTLFKGEQIMEKVMRVGTTKIGGRWASIYTKVKVKDGKLLISGVIGPLQSGNALGSCGQIDMEFAHRDKKDNDSRYNTPITPEEIKFVNGWDKEKWFDLLDIWKRWHLNAMRSECEHQRELGWIYEEHHNPETFEGDKCPVCGYSIGSKWLKEELPKSVIAMIRAFPITDKNPAWV